MLPVRLPVKHFSRRRVLVEMSFVLLAVVIAVLVYWRFLRFKPDTRKTVRVRTLPKTWQTMVQALFRTVGKREGVLSGPVSTAKLLLGVDVEGKRVEAYERMIVFSGGKAAQSVGKTYPTHLPICLPEVVSVELMSMFVVDQGFPLSPLGVIHLRQTITQFAPMPLSGKYEIECGFVPVDGLYYSETERGVELLLRVVMTEKEKGLKVWEGLTTLLSRRGGGGGGRAKGGAAPVFEAPVWDVQSLHDVAGNTGLKYAAISHDYNPHHLWPWSARVMGFRSPIAHGLWTLGSALQELFVHEPALAASYPIHVECDFKKPLFMPGKITFGYRKKGNDVAFGVYDKNNQEPHIICTLKKQ